MIRDDKILLAMKKRGFGAGKWNFSGGKATKGESPEDCIIRETEEELGTKLLSLKPVAILHFYFADKAPEDGWDQKCYVYSSSEWQGEPRESNEMAPQWWDIKSIPYHEMWPEDRSWLEPALIGKQVTAHFLFNSKDQCLDKEIIVGLLNG